MISIVIPVYNGERHIGGLLRSLQAQEQGGFEVVFVDDGSLDGTLALLERLRFEQPFPVRVVPCANAGAGAARNIGLAASKGEYVAFCDVDDVLSPGYMAFLGTAANAAPFDCLRFGIVRQAGGSRDVFPINGSADIAAVDRNDLLRSFLMEPGRFGAFGLLLRRAFLLENRLRFAEGYAYYEDYDFVVRCIAGARELRETKAALYGYRMTHGSAMSRFGAERVQCLRLMRSLTQDVRRRALPVSAAFDRWLVARIYWSVLWQACVALPSPRDAADFLEVTQGRALLKRLKDFPVKRIAATSALCLALPALFALLARAFGGSRTLVARMTEPDAFRMLAELKGIVDTGRDDAVSV